MGNYQIAIYAMDKGGNISPPHFTTVSKNLTRRAIIVAGGEKIDTDPTRTMIEKYAELAYNTLISQFYTPAEIHFMSVTTFLQDIEIVDPTTFFFKNHLNHLAANVATDNLDLTIYLIGAGEDGSFTMNNHQQILTASELDKWLDDLQKEIEHSRITLIYDGNKSGSFIPDLLPPEGKERIIITSTDSASAAYYNTDGNIAFSSFFWDQLASGATMGDAFLHAKQAIYYCNRRNDISFSCYRPQSPLIDANSNGAPNEKEDYDLAEGIRIGDGVVIADEPPIIGSASVARSGDILTITAKDITSPSPLERVWAVIRPISYCPGTSEEWIQEVVETDLDFHEEGWRYEGFYRGACKVTVYGRK
jgi:hypothetical protein